jgi:hypothetical protein
MTLVLNGTTGVSAVDGSASTPAFQGDDTNTGVFFPAADRIGFSTNGVQRGEFDSSGNFQFNSGYGSVATAYACRAWVNFNGTGVVAIRGSGGVTSITDNGVGLYTVNFSITFPDTNYAFFCTTFANRAPGWDSTTATKSTTALSVQNTIPATSSNEDVTQFNVVVFR